MRNGKCTVCPQKCPWNQHVNDSHIHQPYDETIEDRSKEARMRYQSAIENKKLADSLVAVIENDIGKNKRLLIILLYEIRQSLQELEIKALKKTHCV